MKNNLFPHLTIALAVSTIFPALSASAVTLLTDDFATDTSASYSSAGFTASTPGSFNVSGGTLNVTTPSGNGFDYFIVTRPFTTALPTLSVGDSVTVSLTFTPTSIPAQDSGLNLSLALGLVSRGAASASGLIGGLAGAINPTGGNFTVALDSDLGTNSLFFAGSDQTFAGFTKNNPATVANTSYLWSTTVTKLATANQFSTSTTFNGATETSTFTNSTGDSLDGFALAFNKNYSTPLTFSIDNLSATTTAVPEPATNVMIGLGGMLLISAYRFRRVSRLG